MSSELTIIYELYYITKLPAAAYTHKQ